MGNGILYTMMIESDTEDDSRYFTAGIDFSWIFYVSEDKIYRIDENKMEEVNIKMRRISSQEGR